MDPFGHLNFAFFVISALAHLKHRPSGVRGGPEVDKEYVALARSREYVPDGESIYEIIESMGGKMVPHGSQGHPVYSGGNAMDRGSFYDHLTGNEDCVRQWLAAFVRIQDDILVIDDITCGILLHEALLFDLYFSVQFAAGCPY